MREARICGEEWRLYGPVTAQQPVSQEGKHTEGVMSIPVCISLAFAHRFLNIRTRCTPRYYPTRCRVESVFNLTASASIPRPFRQYATARANEIATRKAQQQSIATKAHDLLDDLPELTDSRLAGWRLKKGAHGSGETGVEGDSASAASMEDTQAIVDRGTESFSPQQYDVVEYPLPSHAHGILDGDDRVRGVGVLLSNNRDRLDAASLPAEKIDLCQVEPLTLDPEGQWGSGLEGGEQQVWRKDELEPRVFVAYADLRKITSKQNGMADKWRRWILEEPLSEGCGPPPGAEEEPEIL